VYFKGFHQSQVASTDFYERKNDIAKGWLM